MILYIYANMNTAGEFFSWPCFDKITPEEMAKDYVQQVVSLPQDALKRLKECDLYCLGKFDNVSGEIIPEKTFILHCGEVCSRFIKEDKKDEVSA